MASQDAKLDAVAAPPEGAVNAPMSEAASAPGDSLLDGQIDDLSHESLAKPEALFTEEPAEHALESIESLTRAVEQLESPPPAAAVSPAAFNPGPARAPSSPPAPASSDRQSLPDMDRALASDVDALLEGDFESVDAVLQGVFDEQAAIVQASDGSAAVVNVAAASAPPAVIEAMFEPSSRMPQPEAGAQREATPTGQADQPGATTMKVEANVGPVAQGARQAAGEPPMPSGSTASSEAPQPGEQSPSHEVKSQVEAAPADPAISRNGPSHNAESHEVSGDAAADAQAPKLETAPARERDRVVEDTPATVAEAPVKRHTLSAMAGGGMVTVLTYVNLPLRYVPAKAGQLVNVLAVSLACWVPVVWVMVVMGMGGKEAKGVDAIKLAEEKLKEPKAEPAHAEAHAPAKKGGASSSDGGHH